VLAYYLLLRTVLQTKPHLRACLTRCKHCRIFFLTDPRNARRTDIGCPFGCREAHARLTSTKRSVAYYREECGKIKKRIQNEKRQIRKTPAPSTELALDAEVSNGNDIPPQLLSYLQILISQIEGRQVGIAEVQEMLARILRQRSIARYREVDYMIVSLNEHPP
jgi:hypothetical protein